MSRESEIAAILQADATLLATLTGGVYQDALLGIEGIRRGVDSPTEDAFDDTTGFLLPCALVRDRALVPFGPARDLAEQVASTSQVVEIYLYQDRGSANIYTAKERIYALLEGVSLSDTYPLAWVNETPPIPDVGPVAGATTVRMDFQAVGLRVAA